MCSPSEKGGTIGGNTTSYCLERVDRSGSAGEAAEDYSHRHEQSGALRRSSDQNGQRSAFEEMVSLRRVLDELTRY